MEIKALEEAQEKLKETKWMGEEHEILDLMIGELRRLLREEELKEEEKHEEEKGKGCREAEERPAYPDFFKLNYSKKMYGSTPLVIKDPYADE